MFLLPHLVSRFQTEHDDSAVSVTSRKHLRTKVTPDFHLTYSKNGGNLGSGSNDKKLKILIFLHKIICCGCVLELPHRGDSNTHPKHMILWRTYDN